MTTRRALHFVLKIANRKATIDFYRNVMGMKVLRHEEFEKGCEAACNGPYDGKWSKTMIGYGDEDNCFVIELTYNYGRKSYAMGNDLVNIGVHSKNILKNAAKYSIPVIKHDDGTSIVVDPNGYSFSITEKDAVSNLIKSVTLAVSEMQRSVHFWHELLSMDVYESDSNIARLGFAENQCEIILQKSTKSIDRAESYGRIAFSCLDDEVKIIEKKIIDSNERILTPYISLDTPGKATVQVVILADPDGHEICFVGDVGFRDLSQYDPDGDKLLDNAIAVDKSDDWFMKKKMKTT